MSKIHSNIDVDVSDGDDVVETLVTSLETDCGSFTRTPSDDFDNLNEVSKTMLMSVPPSYFKHLQELLNSSKCIPFAEKQYLRFAVETLVPATDRAPYNDVFQPCTHFVKHAVRLNLLRLVSFWKDTLCQKYERAEAASSANTLFTPCGEVKAHFRAWLIRNNYSAVTHKAMFSREYSIIGRDTEETFRSKLSSFMNNDSPLDVDITYRTDTITDCSSHSIR